MFEIFRRKPRKDVSIWPSSASKSLETVSLLFCTMAFPFSGWKHPDWECSEEDELVFKPACNAFQVKAYFGLFSKKCDDFLLSDLARQSFTETVKSTRRDFGDVLEYFLEAQDTMIACAAGNEGKNEDEYSALLITIAMGWLMLDARSKKQEGEVNLEDPRQEKRLSEFCKYLDHAKTQAVNFFEQMIDTIVDFDVENFKYFTFRKNHSVFEEVLRRRVDFPELFSHMPEVSAALILDARRKELDNYYVLRGQQKNMLDSAPEKLKDYKVPEFARIYGGMLEVIDDLSQHAFGIGGDCLHVYEELKDFRNIFVEMSNQDENLKKILDAFDECRRITLKSKLGGALKWIEDAEIPSYILADTEEEIKNFTEVIDNSKYDWRKNIFTYTSVRLTNNICPSTLCFLIKNSKKCQKST